MSRVSMAAFAAAVLCLALCLAFEGHAQSRPISARLAAGGGLERPSEPDDTVLSRALIAEVDAHFADYKPILGSFQARGDRVSRRPAQVAVRYSSIYRIHPRPLSEQEKVRLESARGPVKDYPADLKAIYRRARQLEIQAMPGVMSDERKDQWDVAMPAVHEWLAGDHTTGCNHTPTHFGDHFGDRARAERMGLELLDCGDTLNMFWRERVTRAASVVRLGLRRSL